MPPFGVACAPSENESSSTGNENTMLPNNYFCSPISEQSANCSPIPAQSPHQTNANPEPDTSKSCNLAPEVNGNAPITQHSYRIVSTSSRKNSTKHSSQKRPGTSISPIRICREIISTATEDTMDVPETGSSHKMHNSNNDTDLITSSTPVIVQCDETEMTIDYISSDTEMTVQDTSFENGHIENGEEAKVKDCGSSNVTDDYSSETEFVSSSSPIRISEPNEKTEEKVHCDSSDAKVDVYVSGCEEAPLVENNAIENMDSTVSNKIDISDNETEAISPPSLAPVQADKIDLKDNKSSGDSKVVVEALPTIDFSKISALDACITDKTFSRKTMNNGESGKSEMNSRIKMIKNGNAHNSPNTNLLKFSASSPNKIIKKRQINQKAMASPSSYSVRKRRSLIIKPGAGMKLADIEPIATAVERADLATLRILHFVMFNKYGVLNDSLVSRTKENILTFSGFVCKEQAELEKKRQCLLKLPGVLLRRVYDILIGGNAIHTPAKVEELMDFLVKPKFMDQKKTQNNVKIHPEGNINEKAIKNYLCKKKPQRRKSTFFRSDIVKLDDESKNRILNNISNGPFPLVKLQRLDKEFVKQKLAHLWSIRFGKNDGGESMSSDKYHSLGYIKPKYITDGPGQKLESFPDVVTKVYKARRRIINLLHSFLYRKPGSEEINRLNILEFSGFPRFKKSITLRRVSFLKKLKLEELRQLCDIFSIRAKRSVKSMSKKLLLFLRAPSLIVNGKSEAPGRGRKFIRKPKTPQNVVESQPTNPVAPTKLRDFKQICFNVDCAPPEELLELNDLLYLKPTDYTEIHEKILNFAPFSLVENVSELHTRKTLLQYMSFEIIRKMARLLDIPAWDQYRSRDDLALTILKFLTDLKHPVDATKIHKRRKSETQVLQKEETSSTDEGKHRPHILRLQKDQNFYSENEMNEYLGSSGINNSMSIPNGYHECQDNENNSTIVIRRISESSYSWTDLRTSNNLVLSNCNSDEAISLQEFAQHPSEDQLQLTIKDVICSNSWSITTGELLNKVLQRYPKFNLFYRSDFIKAKALEILQELGAWSMDS